MHPQAVFDISVAPCLEIYGKRYSLHFSQLTCEIPIRMRKRGAGIAYASKTYLEFAGYVAFHVDEALARQRATSASNCLDLLAVAWLQPAPQRL
jgi:hypothetical protein